MKRILFTVALVISMVLVSQGQGIEGKWKTIDDETGKVKSIVELKINNDKLYGRVNKLFRAPDEDPDPICDKCTGPRKDKKVIGMVIVTGLKKDGIYWEGDDGILDPKNGKVYDCKMWVDENDKNKLNVRGYIGFVYRTQVWTRVK